MTLIWERLWWRLICKDIFDIYCRPIQSCKWISSWIMCHYYHCNSDRVEQIFADTCCSSLCAELHPTSRHNKALSHHWNKQHTIIDCIKAWCFFLPLHQHIFLLCSQTIAIWVSAMDILKHIINDTVEFYKWSLTIAGNWSWLHWPDCDTWYRGRAPIK